MKKIIKTILFLSLFIISLVFYKFYFEDNSTDTLQTDTINESSINKELSQSSENNLIKNLKYQVKLDENNEYNISAKLSEIINDEQAEKVKMQNVIATFIGKDTIPITIKSDFALYNNSNYNTNFNKNAQIQYKDNIIYSDKIDLNFKDNLIIIYDNVLYDGIHGTMNADNIEINLITKKIDINMNNKKDKVKILKK
tara:strand:+ start:609 stop:1199 length:591 start_codon:yes stop_codon:yes gene_type:complete